MYVLRKLLDYIEETQDETICKVANECAKAIGSGKMLYFFGTGHSHMICEEPFYRAGGLANIYPLLEPSLMLHESASASSDYERIEGIGKVVVENSCLGTGDILFLISNSGRNCAVIDAAIEGKRRGAVTVAITSLKHSSAIHSRHSSGKRLFELCQYILDNGCEQGDAAIQLKGLKEKIGPLSSASDITIVNLIIINTVQKLLEMKIIPPIFTSANLDLGDIANKEIIQMFKPKIRNL